MIKEVSYNTDELVISQLQMTLFKLRKYGLTCSLNKRQTIRTMAREVLMSHMAHVGLLQAQFAQKYF